MSVFLTVPARERRLFPYIVRLTKCGRAVTLPHWSRDIGFKYQGDAGSRVSAARAASLSRNAVGTSSCEGLGVAARWPEVWPEACGNTGANVRATVLNAIRCKGKVVRLPRLL